jgi:hypothetical protein
MKVIRNYGSNLTVEVEGRDVKELWRQLSAADDAFGHMRAIAQVGEKLETSDDIHFGYREVDGNDYYELQVASGPLRNYRKSFGQHKGSQTLFPKNTPQEEEQVKKQADKGYKLSQGKMGWHKYDKPR